MFNIEKMVWSFLDLIQISEDVLYQLFTFILKPLHAYKLSKEPRIFYITNMHVYKTRTKFHRTENNVII